MRRLRSILVLSAFVQVLSAAPALAWWDWLEGLRGPGPWKGPVLGARLVCLVAPKTPRPRPGVSQVPPPRTVEKQFVPFGILYSGCDIEKDEWLRGSLDLGMRFLWTHDDRYAQGRKISLTTIEPAYSWSIINNSNRNWVDYGIGAGFYWVASTEFPSVSGGFLEPLRLDFHAPANTAAPWKRIPVIRVGMLVFPAGFDQNAFAPTPQFRASPDFRERASREFNWYAGIYTDFNALIECFSDTANCF